MNISITLSASNIPYTYYTCLERIDPGFQSPKFVRHSETINISSNPHREPNNILFI